MIIYFMIWIKYLCIFNNIFLAPQIIGPPVEAYRRLALQHHPDKCGGLNDLEPLESGMRELNKNPGWNFERGDGTHESHEKRGQTVL